MTALLEFRDRFYAETNIELTAPKNWKLYAKWLQKLEIKKVNLEIMAKNIKLQEAFFEITEILDKSLIQRVDIEETK